MPKPKALDPGQFVSNDEIAVRAGVSTSTVHKWKQRYDDFPEPFVELRIGPIYWWPDIEAWLADRENI